MLTWVEQTTSSSPVALVVALAFLLFILYVGVAAWVAVQSPDAGRRDCAYKVLDRLLQVMRPTRRQERGRSHR